MDLILTLYHEVFFKPLFNGLVFLTGLVPLHDLGLAIIILTIIVRIIIFPFTHRSISTQAKMKKIEPEVKRIREEFKDDQQELARQTMELYRKHGVSPFSGCLMLLIQFPILIALYRVFMNDILAHPEFLYSFVSFPEVVHTQFLGLFNLAGMSIALALITGLSQFIQMRLAIAKQPKTQASGGAEDISKKFLSQAQYIFPVVIVFIAIRFPAALALYWTTSNAFAILHEGIVRKRSQHLSMKETHLSEDENHGSGNPKPNTGDH